jgi:hypothetical protein
MNIENRKCRASADGCHKPDPVWTMSHGRQVEIDDGIVHATVICDACHATGVVRARVEDAEWAPER